MSYDCSQHITHDVSNDSSELVTTKPSLVCLSMDTSSCVYEGDFKHYSPMEAHNETTPHTRKKCWATIVISVGCIVFILSLFKIFGPATQNRRSSTLTRGASLTEWKNFSTKYEEISSTQENWNSKHQSKGSHKVALDEDDILHSGNFCSQLHSEDKLQEDRLLAKNYTVKYILKRVRTQWKHTNTLTDKKKIILTYSPLFDDEDLFKCSSLESFCEFTNDKNKSNTADAIIFHEKDILNNNIPERNSTKQLWIYNNLVPNEYKPTKTIYKGVFNLSATFNFQSDLPILPMYWLEYITEEDRSAWEGDESETEVKIAVYNKNCRENERFLNKYKTIIDEFVKNNITINWYGTEQCNSQNFQPDCKNLSSKDCYSTIAKQQHKFTFAFELSNADFISETFFYPLRYNIMPIVIGSSTKAKYMAVSPPKSFIYYCDFNNTQEVIQHLKDMNRNYKYINRSDQWISWEQWYCQVCGMVTYFGNNTVTIDDINLWR